MDPDPRPGRPSEDLRGAASSAESLRAEHLFRNEGFAAGAYGASPCAGKVISAHSPFRFVLILFSGSPAFLFSTLLATL